VLFRSLPLSALAHLPGEEGLPWVGNSFEFLADPLRYAKRMLDSYGPVSRCSFLFERSVNLISAEANEVVLLDRGRHFSAMRGWQPVLGQLFPRGLMLRDGDDHRYHRRLMQPAFRKEALAAYLERMRPRIARTVTQWVPRGGLQFYPSIKRLTLEIAAEVFLGVELQSEVDQFSHDFHDVVEASTAVNRVPVIGRLYARGIRARARLVSFLQARIAERRAGTGSDLFSQLCRAEDENGQRYSDAEVIDHLIFVMMAAHDTTTSALTTIVYALGQETAWQTRLRELVLGTDRKSTRLNSSHNPASRMPSSA
jgi:cytochrome P450